MTTTARLSARDGNRRVYDRATVAAIYGAEGGLQAPEAAALDMVEARRTPGHPIERMLDIGVGGGRTARALAGHYPRYIGIDYSPTMVTATRAACPGIDIRRADARAMPEIASESVDLVLFSFNGLDSLDHAGRVEALAEIRRVLRPGGAFLFSAHNRGVAVQPAWRRPDLPWPTAPGEAVRRYLLGIANKLRLTRSQIQAPEYALLNDQAHDYAMLVYYIAPEAQIVQLHDSGFTDVRLFDRDGAERRPGPGGISDPWLHYLCWRA